MTQEGLVGWGHGEGWAALLRDGGTPEERALTPPPVSNSSLGGVGWRAGSLLHRPPQPGTQGGLRLRRGWQRWQRAGEAEEGVGACGKSREPGPLAGEMLWCVRAGMALGLSRTTPPDCQQSIPGRVRAQEGSWWGTLMSPCEPLCGALTGYSW